MSGVNGSTQPPAGWIPSEQLEALGISLGVKPRRFAGWRERELIPHPTRYGHEGKRPLYAYPPDTDRRLESVVRWRQTTDDLESIKLALWAEGFPVPTETVRGLILRVLDALEEGLLDELGRFAPAGVERGTLLSDEVALRSALEGYAAELARMRGRFPIERRVEMKLSERERGMRYWLFLACGLETDPADAVQLERIMGLTRGRSGTARGALPWAPQESFHRSTLLPSTLRDPVKAADETAFAFVAAALQTLLFIPTLLPLLIPADSPARTSFISLANHVRETPAYALGVFAALQLANVQRQAPSPELLASYTNAISPMHLIRELLPHLDRS